MKLKSAECFFGLKFAFENIGQWEVRAEILAANELHLVCLALKSNTVSRRERCSTRSSIFTAKPSGTTHPPPCPPKQQRPRRRRRRRRPPRS